MKGQPAHLEHADGEGAGHDSHPTAPAAPQSPRTDRSPNSNRTSPPQFDSLNITSEISEALSLPTANLSLDPALSPVPRGASPQQASPRAVPGGIGRRRGIVFNDSFTDPTDALQNSTSAQQRQASTGSRPRTRTLDAAVGKQRASAGLGSSDPRHRVGSFSSSPPQNFGDDRRPPPISIDAAGYQAPSLGSRPLDTPTTPSSAKDRKASKRLLPIMSSRPSSPLSPAYPTADSLCPPKASDDPNNVISLMKTACGKMRGEIEYQSEAGGPWYAGIAYIDEDTGSLMFDSGQNGQFLIPIISDIRGCRVIAVQHTETGKRCLELSPMLSTLNLLLTPPNQDEFDMWFAAFLCWQQTRPTPLKLLNGKPSTPIGPGRPDVVTHGKTLEAEKQPSIIKFDKLMVWDKGLAAVPRTNFLRSSAKDAWSPTASWKNVSCILQDNGVFTLLLENDVIALCMIDLAQLSRHAIQQLDRTVLNEEFCIAVFPTYCSKASRISIYRPVYIALENRMQFEVWFVLLRAFAIPDIYQLNNPDDDELLEVPDLSNETCGEIFRMEKILSVRVIEAKIKAKATGLEFFFPEKHGKIENDPLVGNYLAEVIVDGEVRARTTTKFNTKNPFWREDCEIVDLAPSVQELSVLVKRVDMEYVYPKTTAAQHRTAGNQEFVCGTVNIALDQLDRGKDHEAWLDIHDEKRKVIGSMLIKVRHEEHVALLAKEYADLSEILHRFPTGLTTLISTAMPAQLRHLAEMFLNIFQASGSASDWLMALVEDEIDGIGSQTSMKKYRFSSRLKSNESVESASDRELIVRDMSKSLAGEANLLFRGNTLLTQSLEFHMRRLGKEYLEETLQNKVFEINELNPDCEVDPSKIYQGNGDIDQHWTLLLRLTTEMWRCIADSALHIPAELRHILKYIRAVAEDRYGDFHRSATYTAVSGFLFLRFICPAILSPKLFGLLRDHPRQKAQRTLTLIAKVLQKLSNLSTFGKREEYMEPMNRFLTTNKAAFRDYIDQVCGIPAERGIKAQPANYSTPLAVMSRLSPTAKEGFPTLPYLIDHPRSFAALVKLWSNYRPEDTLQKGQVDGDLLIFNDLCLGLQKRADACLAKVRRLRAAEAAAQGISCDVVTSLEDATIADPVNIPFTNREVPHNYDQYQSAGSSGSDGAEDASNRNRDPRQASDVRKGSSSRGMPGVTGTPKSKNGKVGRTLLSGIMKIGGRSESPDAKSSR